MNEKEKEFINNLKKKIEFYGIQKAIKDPNNSRKRIMVPVTIRDCLLRAKNKFVTTTYNDGSTELVDIGIEKYLYQCSPYLFIDKYCFIELPGYGRMPASSLYYYQKMILKDYNEITKKYVFTKTRQCGMSTLSSLLFFWKAVCFNGQEERIISKDGDSAQDVLKKIKENLDCIPPWFGLEIVTNNVKSVSFSNKSVIKSLARSPTAGRGGSPTFVLLDESAFYQTASIVEGIVSSVQASLTRTGGVLFVVSTPNGSAAGTQGYWYYKQVKELMEAGGKNDIAKLIDISWWEVLDIEGITPYKGYNEKVQSFIDRDYVHNPSVKLEAEKFFEPVVKDWKNNDWLKYQMETLGNVLFRQEILKDFVVMGNTVFDNTVLEKVTKRIQTPIIENNCDGKNIKGFWIWQKPLPDHKYLLSADVSKGSGDDSSAVQVIDMHTYEQVAEYVGKCTTIDLANYIYDIGCYYNFAYSVIECNSIGEAVFNELFYNLNYPNLYKQIKNKNGIDVATGWMTSMKSREIITNNIIQMYYDDEMWKYYMPHSSRLLEQMKTWIWKGGKPDHPNGEHDDTIMAMAIGLFNIADGIKKIRKPEDIIFYDENGNGINILDKKEESFTDNYLCSNLTNGKELPESVYKSAERQMYQNAGINPEDEDAASRLKWLLS